VSNELATQVTKDYRGPVFSVIVPQNSSELSMSSKRKSLFRRTKDWIAKAKSQAKRRMFLETLEDRRLMAVDLNDPRLFYPAIGKYTADLPAFLSLQDYTERANASSRTFGGNGGSAPSGESGSSSQVFEQEPNNNATIANLVNLGTSPGQLQSVNVSGSLTVLDEDYFAANLRAGDFVKVELTTPQLQPVDVAVFETSGGELIGSTFNQLLPRSLGGPIPDNSPMESRSATVAFAAVIQSTGRHTIRVANGGGSYSLRLSVFRSSFEAESIGTRQIVFLDFDGAILNRTIFGVPGTARIPSLIDTVEPYGVDPSEENLLIDRIIDRVRQNYLVTLPNQGGNGYFSSSGIPGQFDIEFRNSRDHADPWGLPNVSRLIVGGGPLDLGIPTRGIAQSVDTGNFAREETAIVLPEIFFLEGIEDIPLAASRSLIDVLAVAVGQTGSHEVGHLLGARHQENTNRNLQLMDSGGQPIDTSRIGVGPDGIFGTADDVNITFGRDRYAFSIDTNEGLTGTVNHAINLAFALSTGTRGGSVTGLVFNDRNRNARQDGSENTLAGWEVFVDSNNNGVRDTGEPRTTTDSTGRYNLQTPPGTFNLRVVHPAGWVPSVSSEAFKTVTVSANATASANFGAFFPSVGATGFKWLDLNGDGVRDVNEPGLAGVYIYLDLDMDGRPDVGEPAALSGSDGSYTLTPPRPGTYRIREVVDPGYVQTFPASGFHAAVFDGSTPLAGFDFGNRESSDWGDAPARYPTTRAQNGASHGFVPGLSLGANWDAELDGVNSIGADADDLNAATDDEDGITLLSPIVRGDSQNSIRITVNRPAGTTAYVQGWVDFNDNGSWSDPGEQIVTNLQVSAGDNIVNFTTPANAVVGRTAARFRLSTSPGLGPTGRASGGEVEDYTFNIVNGPRRNLQDDLFSVNRNSTANLLDVLANDFVPPSDSISAVLLGTPSQGGVATVGAGNVVRYTPARGFFGQETFSYTVVFGSGRRETANVTVNVALQFIDPVAVDDSFDLPTDSVSFPLNVLLNDIEGQNGALTITSITTPDQGGSAVIGSGGLSIRYTPRRGFGGTERFTYTATDGGGKSTTAEVTLHTLGGDRLDDEVQFSFDFRDMAGNPITRVTQGDQFQVYVYTFDLRPDGSVEGQGVYAAYLDLLYSSNLVLPASPGPNTQLDFANNPQIPYRSGVSGTAQIPGVISSLGAFTGSSQPPYDRDPDTQVPIPTNFQILTFNARSAGIAEFVGDPANESPNTDVLLWVPPNSPVPVEKVRYLRSSIEVLPRGVETPFAVDDSPAPLALNTTSFIDVLRNDIVGTAGPIRITRVTQPNSGVVSIDTRGTESPTDDRIQFVPFSSNVGFSDQFTYTIADTRGFTSTATVTVQVGDASANDNVRLTLRTTDAEGNVITSIPVGGEFELRGYVQDLRTPFDQSGVFAAYQDILYDRNLVAVRTRSNDLGFDISFAPVPPLTREFAYEQGQSGDILIPGLINEVGSFQNSFDPLGSGEFLQFRIRMRANAAGVARFAGDPADISPFHDTLLFSNQSDEVPFDRITYVPAQIIIGGSGSGGGAGEGNTNSNNRSDVNNDGFVSPIDVLILVNLMNQGQGGALGRGGNSGGEGENSDKYFVDVDSDGFLTPLDALIVVNELNSRSRNGGGGNGEGEGLSAPLVQSTAQVVSAAAPVLQTSLSRAQTTLIGPQVAVSGRSLDYMSLDSYLAGLVDEDEEDDELDEITSDLLRVRFES
jgi:hypothetical protein